MSAARKRSDALGYPLPLRKRVALAKRGPREGSAHSEKEPLTRLARFRGLATLSRKGRGCRSLLLEGWNAVSNGRLTPALRPDSAQST
jgi:hypothetical protein